MAFLGPSLRRTKVLDRPVRRAAAASLISLAVNAGLLLLLAVAGAFEVPKAMKEEKVELAQVTDRDWERNRTVLKVPGLEPPPKVEPPAPPEKKVEEKGEGQVVDVAPSLDSRPPPEARFRAEQNNRVDKETRSRWQGAGKWRNRAPAPIPGQDGKKGGPGSGDEQTREARQGQGGATGKGGKARPSKEPRPQEDGDRLARLDRPTLPRTGPEKAGASGSEEDGAGIPGLPGEAEEQKQRSGDPRLLPSLEDMARIAAGPSNDALPADLEEGDVTALNTRAYRFATFWNRFKQDVADHWYPGVRYEIDARDPEGTTFGRSDRVTGLRIVLDAAGAVKKIEVTAPSGLDFLDRVAVKSIRDAAPFYNLPAGLLDTKGELSFEFGFLVGTNRGIPIRPRWQSTP